MRIEDRKFYTNIRVLTVILAGIVSLISLLFLRKIDKATLGGIWIGACCGLMGFQSIISSVSRLPDDINRSKTFLQGAYVRRYILYGIVFFLSAYQEIHILAVLFGMLCHKVSIVFCVMIDKERRRIHATD